MPATRTSSLMSIGQFARRTRLSYKALRLYDAMGLLPPHWVDPDSGYRYYHEAQVEVAKLIGLLRQLEMPLGTISEVLELRGREAVLALTRYWQGVEADLQVKRDLVRYLERYLEGKGETMFDIETRRIAEQHVATIQRRVYVKDLPLFISEAMTHLYAHLGDQAAAAPNFVIYHGQVNEDSDGPVEVCVPFTGSLEPTGEIRLRVEPAHAEAYTRITKVQVAFPGILEAYDAVGAYLRENGLEMADPPREVYFTSWDALGDDDPACDIAFPYHR